MRQLLFTLACALCLPAAAGAQERARPDPNSPAGVEYQLPLDQARDDAAGGGKRRAGAQKGAPLFGSGITKDGSRAAGGESGTDREGGTPGFGPAERSAGATWASVRTPDSPPASAQMASESASDSPSVFLIAAAVLLAGGLLGLGLRRGMGRTRRS